MNESLDPQYSTEQEPTIEELIRQMALLRQSTQRWHETLRRNNGGCAADYLRGQGRVLSLLNLQGEMPQRQMGYILNIRPQSLGEVLIKLEKAGYVERHPSPTDRRALIVSITEAGKKAVEDTQPIRPAFDGFSDQELTDFIGYLRRAVVMIDTATDEILAKDNPAPIEED